MHNHSNWTLGIYVLGVNTNYIDVIKVKVVEQPKVYILQANLKNSCKLVSDQ